MERYAAALAANDSTMMRECLAPDYVGRYPQSGELIRGVENRLAIGENFPGQEEAKLSGTIREIRGRDDEFVSTASFPAWTIVHLTGSNDEFTLTGTVNYPNGETWQRSFSSPSAAVRSGGRRTTLPHHLSRQRGASRSWSESSAPGVGTGAGA